MKNQYYSKTRIWRPKAQAWMLTLFLGLHFSASGQVTYHLGNSLTDTKNGMLAPLSNSAGKTHVYLRSTIPGAPTDWIWDHPATAFGESDYRVVFDTKGPIDHLFTQPFAGHDRSVDNEADYSGRFYNLARQKSPNVQHWLYQQWPDKAFSDNWSKGTGATAGLGLTPATSWEKGVCNHLAYQEVVRNLMDSQTGGKLILIVPAGLGLARLKIEIDNGRVPGITNFFDTHFSDDLHLSGRGAYMVNLVHYACIYQETPVGKVTYKPADLSEEQATIYKQIAWNVASDYPWSGMNGPGTLRNEICSTNGGGNNGGGTANTGTVIQEFWTGIGGTAVSAIPLNTPPSGTSVLTSLETPVNWGDNYGTRIRGYLHPPASGWYTFSVAGDDNAEFYLSSDPNPANKGRVAHVPGWTNAREWTKYPEQTSQQVYLTAGGKFYFELLGKEAGGGDNLAVGWTGPNISTITIPGGAAIEPYAAPLPATCGEVNNFSFENNLTGWTNNGATVVTTDAFAGGKAAKTGPGGEGGLHYGSLIPVAPYQAVTFSIRSKVEGAPQWAGAGIDFLDASGNILEKLIHTVTATAYIEYTGTLNAPANTANVRIWTWKSWDGGAMYLDNVCLTKGAISNPNPNPNPTANKMGVNLVMDMAFANVIDEGLRAEGVTSYDAQGWPQSDFKAIFDWRLATEWFGSADDPEGFRIQMSGTYKCSLEGQADLSGQGMTLANKVYNSSTNTTTFEVIIPTANNGRNYWDLVFSNTKRTPSGAVGTGITKLKVMRPGYEVSTTYHQERRGPADCLLHG